MFTGEISRIAKTDKKLSKTKAPYFESRFNEIINYTINVTMDEVNTTRLALTWDPRDSYKVNENDIYLAVLSSITKSKYIITNDQEFRDAYNCTFENRISLACLPKKFLSLEKIFY